MLQGCAGNLPGPGDIAVFGMDHWLANISWIKIRTFFPNLGDDKIFSTARFCKFRIS